MDSHNSYYFSKFLSEKWGPATEGRTYDCGFCGRSVVANVGLETTFFTPNSIRIEVDVRLCPRCRGATTFVYDGVKGSQLPAPLLGKGFDASEKEEDIQLVIALYNDARNALSQDAGSCAVLMFRKLLMHVAVEQGAKEGERFVTYVQFLKDKGVVGRPQHKILNRIKDAGNEENHQIKRSEKDEANDLLDVVTHLIEGVYFLD